MTKLTKQEKRILSRVFKKSNYDEKPKSLVDDSRTFWDSESENLIEYGFIWSDIEQTDEEIVAWLDYNVVRRIPEHMYWDCTGQLFTWDISWHRNPNGMISFVNRMSYDI